MEPVKEVQGQEEPLSERWRRRRRRGREGEREREKKQQGSSSSNWQGKWAAGEETE